MTQTVQLNIDLPGLFNQIERMRSRKIRNYVAGTILELVEDYHGKEPGFIMSKASNKRSATERNMATYLLMNLGYSQSDVAKLIRKDNSSVSRYYSNHVLKYERDSNYKQAFDEIKKQLPGL